MKSLYRLLAALAVVALAGTMMSVASPAKAAPAPADRVSQVTTSAEAPDRERQQRCFRKCFGAISMSPDQAWGGYRNTATRASAVRKAHNICKRNSAYPGRCRKLGWVRNGC